jgi:hypothetical protein
VALAIASSAWALAFFRPSIPERVMRPTALARYLWNRYPAVHDPVPEIFAEMVLGAERVELPITADHCTKVLLHEGRWPLPCVPQPVPPECETRNQLCYANRSVAEYSFSRVSTSLPPVAVPGEAWTPGQAAVFRTRLSSLPWWTLRWRRSGTGDSAVRAIDGVRRSWVMQAHGLLVVVGREVGSDASLVLRTPVPVQATITDLETGASVSAIEEEDSRTDPWRLAVPGPRPMVLVVMTAR